MWWCALKYDMVAFPLARFVPFLLATRAPTSPTTVISTTTTTTARTFAPQEIAGGDAIESSLRTPTDLTASFSQLYRELERPGAVHVNVTSTLRFSLVTPPLLLVSTTTTTKAAAATKTTNTTKTTTRESFKKSTWRQDDSFLTSQQLDEMWRHDPRTQGKPIALYIPGLDGYGISAAQHQFDDLAEHFELWRLTVLPEDRSSFAQVVQAIADFVSTVGVQQQPQQPEEYPPSNRPVILIAESCGAVLATASAYRLYRQEVNNQQQQQQSLTNQSSVSSCSSSPLAGLVLVNPATSFEQTTWDQLVPLITSLKYLDQRAHENDTPSQRQAHQNATVTPYSVVGSLLLSAIIPDLDQWRRIVTTIVNLPDLDVPPSNQQQINQVWNATLTAFAETGYRLPPDTLQHRVMNWLIVGTPLVNARLQQQQPPPPPPPPPTQTTTATASSMSSSSTTPSFVQQLPPTLVVVGRNDRLLPSEKEADRLIQLIGSDKCEKLVVPNRGHFVLDENVNLTEAILYSKIVSEGIPKRQASSASTSPSTVATASAITQTRRSYNPVRDWQRPSPAVIAKAIEKTVAPQRVAHSPVFFSTDSNGKRWKGLTKLPTPRQGPYDGPLLFVGNHQFGK